MALGGGTWLFQNKKLPGTYINFVSRVRASTDIADRGYATMPLEMDWGPVGSVFAVTAEDFQERSLPIFGYVRIPRRNSSPCATCSSTSRRAISIASTMERS